MIDYSKEPGKELRDKYILANEIPLVTIITLFHNSSKNFEQTFNSVINQTFPWFEWIIVNVGSTPDETAFISCYSKLDQRISVYYKENEDYTSASNVAIKKATTELIMPLDAGDLIEPQHLECLYWALITTPNTTWSYSGLVAFGTKHYLEKHIFTLKNEKNIIINGLVKKKALEEAGKYQKPERLYNGNWQKYLMLAKGYNPVQIEQYSFWYRTNEKRDDITVAKNSEILKNKVRNHDSNVIHSTRFNGHGYAEFEALKKWKWNRKLHFRTDKKRILLLIPHMVMGGTDKFNYELLKKIDQEKYSISIITTVNDKNIWKQKFAEYTDDIFELPQFLHFREWPAFIYYFLYTRNIDLIININSFYAYYLLPCIRMEFPDICIIDYVHADSKYWRSGGYARTSSYLDNTLEKTIIANKATMDIMINDYGKDIHKCILSYIGTDESYFDPSKVTYGIARSKLGISIKRPIVLFLCRLCHEKRCYLMIEIAKQLHEQIPDVAFMVVGDGECLNEMKHRVNNYELNDTVYFAGAQEDVREYYRDADVLLICSIKEGLTLTTFEGMSMELPIVSSNVGSQGEIVNQNTGALIECLQDEVFDFAKDHYDDKEIQDYVHALFDLLNNKKKAHEIGRNNRKLIKQVYSFKYAVKLIEKIADNCSEEKNIKMRREQSVLYIKHRKAIEEFLILYSTYESKCIEANELWNHNCHLQNLIQEKQKPMEKIQLETNTWITELEQGKHWLEQQVQYKDIRIKELENWTTKLTESTTELEQGKHWLEQQVQYKDMRIKELENWITELEKGKKWLEKQVQYKNECIKELKKSNI